MSPLVSEVVPVYQSDPKGLGPGAGRLETLRPQDLKRIYAAECVIDAWVPGMLVDASAAVDVPIFEMLGSRPELEVSLQAREDAARLQSPHGDAIFIGLNLTKYGRPFLETHGRAVLDLLRRILDCHPRAVILNIFPSCYRYDNWPEPQRTLRRNQSVEEAEYLCNLSTVDSRIIPCVDLPLISVAALLMRCKYFIGVDNGIKHLAWALQVPLTIFHPARPILRYVLHWMPDVHRMLLFDASDEAVRMHVEYTCAILANSERHRLEYQ
jgi:hypothetical protein